MSHDHAQAERLRSDRARAIPQPLRPDDLKPVAVPPPMQMTPEAEARPDALRPASSILIFMIAQTTLSGIGAILILSAPLSALAYWLMAPMIVVTTILSVVAAWKIEPALRAWSRERRDDAPPLRDPATRRR